MNQEIKSTMSDEKRQFVRLEKLAKTSSPKLFSLSPNDVLVQIALPLVLILAIATRLMMMATQDEGPVILELWKQQLILRIDWVLDKWEKESGLSMFPDFNRVQWNGIWPDDQQYQRLCANGKDLANIENLTLKLYHEALEYKPENISQELTIDEEGRQYAL